MSRTATATPPPPLFQQKNASPSARHVSKGGNLTPPPGGAGFQRHFKKPYKASSVAGHGHHHGQQHHQHQTSPLKQEPTVAPMSASDVLGMLSNKDAPPDPMSTSRSASIVSPNDTDTASIATSTPSLATDRSDGSYDAVVTPDATPSSSLFEESASFMSPSASSSSSASASAAASAAASASPRSWVNGFGKVARAATGMMGAFSRRPREGESPRMMTASPAPMGPPSISPAMSLSPYVAPSPSSTPYLAPSPHIASPSTPMSPMAFMLTPAPEVAEMPLPALPLHALPPAVAHPHNMPPALAPMSPNVENPAEALRRYEWAEEQRKQVTEFARLCSQWPQSSYNQAKWGPNGCPNTQYIPQSWANPRHVVRTMQRQAELERFMCDTESTFFESAPRSARSSSAASDSEPSIYSSSAATSASRASEQDRQAELCAAVWAAAGETTEKTTTTSQDALRMTERKTAAELQAAMASPMVEAWRGDSSVVSVSSSVSVAASVVTVDAEDKEDSKSTSAWASLACSTRSLSELDRMADLATTDCMDVDDEGDVLPSVPAIPGSHPASSAPPPPRPVPAVAPVRAQSCPAKRPLTLVADDEDKRRRIEVDDEVMVVDDSTPVFFEEPAVLTPSMSSSVPNLSQSVPAIPLTVCGHPIKTSTSHPIIISPFIPTEIMSTLGKYLVVTPSDPGKPLLLSSELDIPSLLLSCAAPSQSLSEAGPTGTPFQSEFQKTIIFHPNRPRNGSRRPTRLGNLVLSSCPGKRLRMDGPVKGRGPVCRDLATDLRRIKGQGVGAIVCCLDDDELQLLGVPWAHYRELASEIGLDVIRLPMPDGFTPVSLQLFDAQVTLIAQRYTLQGIDVLVHCRGGIGRAGLTACAWAIKMGFVQPHPSLSLAKPAHERAGASGSRKTKATTSTSSTASQSQPPAVPSCEEERAVVMSMVERVIAMIRCRRGLKAIESMEQVQFLATYTTWLRECSA